MEVEGWVNERLIGSAKGVWVRVGDDSRKKVCG